MIAKDVDRRIATMDADSEMTHAQASGVLIDPFGLQPTWASRLSGLGGEEPSADPAYVFHTLTVGPTIGPAAFVVRFEDLKASGGWMLLRLMARSELQGGLDVTMRTVKLSVAELVATGGEVSIAFVSRRNMLYSLCCHLYDTPQAHVSALSVVAPGPVKLARQRRYRRLDQIEPAQVGGEGSEIGEGGGMQAVPRLLNLESPTLPQPVSQGWTAAQCAHGAFTEWLSAAGRKPDPTPENWEIAYLFQVLRRYGALKSGATCLGVGGIEPRNPIPALLAKHGCYVTMANLKGEVVNDYDPGLALEQLVMPDICAPAAFFDKVDITTLDALSPVGALANFDFIWSARVSDRMESVIDYQNAVDGMTKRLRPGGLAVHLFRLAPSTGVLPHGAFALARADVERMVLAMIAQGHAVAQLKFGYREQASLKGRSEIPFGVIVRASGAA